jgi:hypothetical protein
MMRTLFLQAPSCDGFDDGAGSRYQARREVRSFWYPTWHAQAAASIGSQWGRRALSRTVYRLNRLHGREPLVFAYIALIG